MAITREEIGSLEGFTHLGSGWFKNADDSYRVRKWIGYNIDVWHWGIHEDDHEIRFKGHLFTLNELKWILGRVCV